MKKILRGLAARFGYTIGRWDARVEVESISGPNLLLYALQDLAGRSPGPLRVVQIGANDGSEEDPLQEFLSRDDCEAILIEPMDHPFAVLAERYAGRPSIRTVQAAISDKPGVMEMHYIADAEGTPALTLYSSFDLGTVERNLAVRQKGNPDLSGHRIRTKTIQARTLKDILTEFDFGDVDAVVVDAEGFDHRIVGGFLRDGVEPRIIRFEYTNLTIREFSDIRRLLKDKGYEIARVGIDMYCQKAGLLR